MTRTIVLPDSSVSSREYTPGMIPGRGIREGEVVAGTAADAEGTGRPEIQSQMLRAGHGNRFEVDICAGVGYAVCLSDDLNHPHTVSGELTFGP